jgi:hypothetical protein
MTPPLSIVLAISYAALTAMFVGMFALLAGILVRALLPGHVARRGYASEWVCLRPESEARGLALLKEWLSPAQLNTYENRRYFEVVGCDTGTIYRIHHGFQGNVEQIDAFGRPVCRWCFGPENTVVAGDVMLAQKIALEAYESGALGVANRLSVTNMARG